MRDLLYSAMKLLGCVLVSASCGMEPEEDLLSQKDRTFLIQATYFNLAEAADGSIALQQGHNEPVQHYGMLMHSHHNTAQNDLNAIAELAGMQAPQETDQERRDKTTALKALHGVAFDSTYLGLTLAGHDKAIALHETHISEGRNPRLRQYAAEKLELIRRHRATADSLSALLFP